MGESSQTQQTRSSTGPWKPAQGPLKDIVGDIANTDLGQNPYADQYGILANDLLSGGTDRSGMVQSAYDTNQARLDPIASGAGLDVMNNPVFQNYLNTITNDAKNSINSQFASYGRDLSPEHAQALGRGISQGTAPAFFGAYENERANQMNAINNQFTGGVNAAGALSGLDNQAIQRRLQGLDVGTAQQALPLQNAAIKSSLLLPIAGLGQEGRSQTTATTKANPVQVATGGILGGLGLLSGNPMMAMGGMGGAAGSMTPFGFLPSMYDPWQGLR